MTVPSMPVPKQLSEHDPRRRLRLLEESDAEDLYTVVDANRDYLARCESALNL